MRECVSGTRVRALPAGVDGKVFRPLAQRRALRRREGLGGAFVVGCVTRNGGHSRLPALMKACARLRAAVPEIVLLVATDTVTFWPKEGMAPRHGWDLAELADRYGIGDRLVVWRKTPWHGATERELNRLYNLLDVLALCGVGDGLGLEALEAMAAGVPIVAPDYGVPAEIVGGRGLLARVSARWLSAPDAEELILPDEEDLAGQLLQLYRDDDLRGACIRKGRRFAERHSLDRVAAKWGPVLDDWLASVEGRRVRRINAEARRTKRILVRRDRGIGDVLFALSAAYQYKQDHPRTRIEFATQEQHAEWVSWFDFVEHVHTAQPETPFDRELDYERELDYGFKGDRCQWMARRAGVEVSGLAPPPQLPDKLLRRVRRRLPKIAGGRRLALAPHGSRGTLVRSLTQEQVRAAVAAVHPEDTIVLLSEERLGRVAGANVANLTGELSVEEALAAVSLCDGLVGVDSGLLHWAGVFRKPVVALFTHIGALQRMGAHGNFIALQPSLPCAPCGDVWPRGPHGHQPPCRPDYQWMPEEPRVDCLRIHDGSLSVAKLYELLDGQQQRTVVNLDAEGNSTHWRLPSLAQPMPCAVGARDARPQSDALTSVIILNHNTWDRCTRRCVKRLLENTAEPVEVILLDNGSRRAETQLVRAEWTTLAEHHPRVRLVLDRSSQNLGFPGGVNRALRSVSPEARYVCLLNSDCYLEEPDWNVRAAGLFAQDWRLAALSLTQGEHRYFLDGKTGRDYFFPELDATFGDCEVINGACLLVDRSKTGPFSMDERFSPASREDDDLSFWIREQGWAVGQPPDFRISHEHGTTLKRKGYTLRWRGEEIDYFELQDRNRDLLLEKWEHMLHPRLGARGSLKAIAAHYRPRVSVILPTHHRLEVNDLAIQSVLRQRMADLELLIVTVTLKEQRELRRRYREDSRVRVLRQKRKGIANARNTGLVDARGRYLAHMDDDECWRPDHLARMVAFMDNHPDVMLAYADVHRVRGRFRKSGFKQTSDEGYPWCGEFDLGAFREANCIPASAAVLRRETIETVGFFDESFRYADDWEYWLRVAANHRVAHNCTLTHDGVATVEYRMHEHDQATGRDADLWAEEFARIRQKYAPE